MKNISILILLVLLSCKKDKVDTPKKDIVDIPKITDQYPDSVYPDKVIYNPGSMKYGFMKAKKNGLDWQASADAIIYTGSNGEDGLFMFANTYSNQGFDRERLGIIGISAFPKKYIPFTIYNYQEALKENHINTTYERMAGDGNILAFLPEMMADTTVKTNYIDIIKIDTVNKVMIARFDISLINRSKYNKEKMRFSEGYLEVKFRRQ